jgi:hypothetical protein
MRNTNNNQKQAEIIQLSVATAHFIIFSAGGNQSFCFVDVQLSNKFKHFRIFSYGVV